MSLKQKQYEYPEQVYCQDENKRSRRQTASRGQGVRFHIQRNSKNF